jgi:hypothetical protein
MYEDNEMEAEFGAHLRTTQGDLFLNTLKNIKFKDRNSTEQFYTLVDAAFNLMLQNDVDFISDIDKQTIIDNIQKINKIGYKSPVGYILGYYASSGGSNINEKNVTIVFNSIKKINSLASQYPIFKISKPDIIRYARFWITLNKNNINM